MASPTLDLDDTDGWGPENINLKTGQVGAEYWIGVHYWRDHGYGVSVATARIWIYGKVAATLTSKPLKQCDMWWVGRTLWATTGILTIGGAD